jgi:uncharacterized LabA/DUF88 family protein
VGVFLDASNIHVAVKQAYKKRKEEDHGRILKVAIADNHLHRAIAYCVEVGDHIDTWQKALAQYGFEFRTKRLRRRFRDGTEGDMDMEIAMDVWRCIDQVGMVVLLSGDGHFTELVRRCRELGKVVRVMGVPGTVSRSLIEAADEFVPIDDSMVRDRRQKDTGTFEKVDDPTSSGRK